MCNHISPERLRVTYPHHHQLLNTQTLTSLWSSENLLIHHPAVPKMRNSRCYLLCHVRVYCLYIQANIRIIGSITFGSNNVAWSFVVDGKHSTQPRCLNFLAFAPLLTPSWHLNSDIVECVCCRVIRVPKNYVFIGFPCFLRQISARINALSIATFFCV